MATHPATPADQRAEAREFLRSVHERNARSREEVQRRVASLRQIAETLRARRRPWLGQCAAGLPVAEQAAELDSVVDLLADALLRHDEYTRHVAVVLDNLQRVVSGALNVDLSEYIERGILEPARDLLTQAPDENIRLSVLVPEGERWRMIWSAGHTLAGREGYNEAIADTLSRYAFETGRTQTWDDVLEDRGFE